MKTVIGAVLSLLLFVAVPAWADGVVVKQSTCKLQWDAPQANVDGSNLADLAAYDVYIASTPAAVAALTVPTAVVTAPELDPPAAKIGEWPCSALPAAQYYAQVRARDTGGNASGRTPALPFVSQDDVSPQVPGNLRLGP